MNPQNDDQSTQRKANLFTGFLLFLVSIVLFITTTPFGFIYGLVHSLFKHFFKGVGGFFLEIAVSIDQLGNVIMQHLLNMLWLKKGGYKFGNRDETISSVLGKNKVQNTLSGFGKFIVAILDIIDSNHVLDSIDYYVQPKN
ncbi:hypothetical protein [Aquimarina sp. 2304DJ70-9]|uniref:hypothetical protein n=1 Tax=Aquimarina penaris TaxID=3231044 RepID=UPI00346313B4